ncbi:hypothetical protein [Amycolatopsis anabasis]|uniref:hypothetical protein n=1 Tax=Amycolatopsis anabasis TaxID=1840409 RepID=UPI00131BAEB3|nr:hypothetical protein [Amycolatopsis anabasis]
MTPWLVIERLLVYRDAVHQVDEQAIVLEVLPADALYRDLVLAGAPDTADMIDLLVDAAARQVHVRVPDGPPGGTPLPPRATQRVLAYYGTQVDTCEVP